MTPEGTGTMPQTPTTGPASSAAGGAAGLLARSTALRRVLAAGAGVVLTALAARVAVPVPGSPVPFTLQVLAVLLVGVALGPRLGAASMVAYLGAGAVGLPVFAAGGGLPYLLGPTGGYLLAFPAAAAAAGWGCWERDGLAWHVLGLAAAVLAVHAGGAGWLVASLGLEEALARGSVPFLLLDGVKAALVLVFADRIAGAARSLLA